MSDVKPETPWNIVRYNLIDGQSRMYDTPDGRWVFWAAVKAHLDFRDWLLSHILDELEDHEFSRQEIAAHLREEIERLNKHD